MVGEGNKNVCLIQINASNFAEFEISEFEVLRIDCNCATASSAVPAQTPP